MGRGGGRRAGGGEVAAVVVSCAVAGRVIHSGRSEGAGSTSGEGAAMGGLATDGAATYFDWLRARYPQQVRADGRLNDVLNVRDGRLHFRDLDLAATVREYGSPLELVYTPLITERVEQMI